MEPIKLPTPDEVRKRIDEFDLAVQRDVLGAREYLRRRLKTREIRLRAGADGIYTATTEVLPLVLLTETPPSGLPREASVSSRSCGGAFAPVVKRPASPREPVDSSELHGRGGLEATTAGRVAGRCDVLRRRAPSAKRISR